MENMEDFCVSHNYTQRDLLLLPQLLLLILYILLPTSILLLLLPPSSTSSSSSWYFKRCISNVAVWKSTGKTYGKMKCFKWPYLYLKKENQNWELSMCKIKNRNEYLFVCYKYALSTIIQSVVSLHPKRQHE